MISQTEKEVEKLKAQDSAIEKINAMGGTVKEGKAVVMNRDFHAEGQLDCMVGPYMLNICEHYPDIIKAPHIGPLLGLFKRDVPTVVVGAGPSLDKNIEQLNDFPGLIFACDGAAKTLTAHGIHPDLVVTVDHRRLVIADMLDYPESKDQTLIMTISGSPEIPRVWKGRLLYSSEEHPGTQFFDHIIPTIFPGMPKLFCVGNVGNFAIQLACAMGCAPIVLVGQDYGYTGRKMHADHWRRNGSGWERIATDHEAKFEHRAGKLEVDGIWTYPPYTAYLKTLKQIHDAYKMEFINATEGGIITDYPRMTLQDAIKKLDKTNNRAKGWARHHLAEALGGKK